MSLAASDSSSPTIGTLATSCMFSPSPVIGWGSGAIAAARGPGAVQLAAGGAAGGGGVGGGGGEGACEQRDEQREALHESFRRPERRKLAFSPGRLQR